MHPTTNQKEQTRLAAILASAAAIVDEALKLEPDRKGAFLCIADAKAGIPIVIFRCGSPPAEKVAKYIAFCQEKAARLAANPEHNSGWQSRNPAEDKVEGSVRGQNYIFSLSGLSSPMDEAAVFVLATVTDELAGGAVAILATLSGNTERFRKLQNAVELAYQ